jgi:hypothetical protein
VKGKIRWKPIQTDPLESLEGFDALIKMSKVRTRFGTKAHWNNPQGNQEEGVLLPEVRQ